MSFFAQFWYTANNWVNMIIWHLSTLFQMSHIQFNKFQVILNKMIPILSCNTAIKKKNHFESAPSYRFIYTVSEKKVNLCIDFHHFHRQCRILTKFRNSDFSWVTTSWIRLRYTRFCSFPRSSTLPGWCQHCWLARDWSDEIWCFTG